MMINGVVVSEKRDIQSLTYVLESTNLFFPTAYKVLKSHEDDGFVKCNRLKFNGKDKLMYDIANYKVFDGMLPTISMDTFSVIMVNFLKIILQVKNNGFMRCENIDISLDKIFVDINSCRVYLIYLPIELRELDAQKSFAKFEMELRRLIFNLLTNNKNIINSVTLNIRKKIQEPTYSLDDMMEELKIKDSTYYDKSKTDVNGFNVSNDYEVKKDDLIKVSKTQIDENKIKNSKKSKGHAWFFSNKSANLQESVVLEGVNTPIETKINLNKSEITIGKMVGRVDFAIGYNPAVSRIHCKIIKKNNLYYIIDLGSSNGTFVNDNRIGENQAVQIKIGDRVKIANMNFILKNE